MRRVLLIAGLVLVAGALLVAGTGQGGGDDGTYRVRAIFDNAFALVEGEDVKVAGVRVGDIGALEVTPDNRAAVVLDITEPGFQDFRADARCTIRPQSLIGERYIECTPTEPRAPGQAVPPPLREVTEGPAAGQHVLPADRTSRPVDLDLINNITRLPQRQRLAIILNELGAGLAGRGEDLNATIRRANPALAETNDVLEILGEQNEVLADLAEDSDRVLGPLAGDRDRLTSFIERAGDTAAATATRRAALDGVFARLPRFLAELEPTMQRLGQLSGEFTPVLRELRSAAPDVNRLVRELGPFSRAGIPAFRSLGETTDVGRPALARSRPLIADLRRLTATADRPAGDLRELLDSLRSTGGIERLMDVLFFQTSAINGYDALGHYLRAGLIVNTCSDYALEAQPGCSSNFAARERRDDRAQQASAASAAPAPATATPAAEAEDGLLEYLLGDGS